MQRRTYLALTGTSLTTALAGCGTDEAEDNGRDRDRDGGDGGAAGDDGGDEEATPTAEEPSEAGQLSAVSQNTGWLETPTSRSGSGQTVTDPFEAARFTTFVYEHSGESNFIVELINDDSGEREDILINEIGAVSGAVGAGLEEGSYVLDVDADGDWSIEAGEPFAPDDEYGVPPASITGDANDVYGEVEIDGRVTVTGEHSGESNFIVEAWDEANTGPYPDEIIFNEIGGFQGETSVQLEGLFYIAVEGDGEYQIEIE